MSSASRSLLLPLCAGLALGAGGTWTVRHLASPDHASVKPGPVAITQTTPSSSPAAPAPALLLPPRLSDAEADAALDAWLALPPLPDKAPVAETTARTARLRALLTILPTEKFGRLFAALATRVGGAEVKVRRAAFDVWTEHDAPAAARWAAALVPGEAINEAARARYASGATLAWADAAFDDAYIWATTLGDTKLGADLARQLLAKLIVTDPTRALSLAHAAGDEFFAASQQDLFRAWAAKDPAAAVQSLGAALLEKEKYSWPVREALGKWLARDPQRAFDWIIAQPPGDTDSYNSLLGSIAWNLGEPAAIRALSSLLLAHPELPGQSRDLRQLTGAWARGDPKAALAWLEALPDVEKRTDLIEQSLGYLKADDFLAFAQHLPEGKSRDDRISDYLANWAQSAPDKALAWLDAHDSPELAPAVARVQGVLIANLAKTDPAAALAKWQGLPDAADKTAALGPLALAWAKTDPAAAARWLAPLVASSDASSRGKVWEAYNAVASRLALSDPKALMKLAETQTDPGLRQTAYNALANDYFYEENGPPASATMSRPARAELLASIPDEKARTPILSNLLTNWLRRDFQSARAWIDAHDVVSPELAARLISQTDPSAP